ncbi:MAG TPA: copper amine oxidase N-terminal domain-containing protein [Symbiobacteriaceae bacterium]|nr:copper amine oxidase N-terminal domain-containing protein [Symbiobacteriaceae bacterium]
MTVRKLVALAVAVLTLLALAGGARAEVTPTLPKPALTVVLTGTLEYVTNLETPHYEIDGWAVSAPDQAPLAMLQGMPVTVTGQPVGSVSILMRRQIAVSSMTTVLEGELQATDGSYLLNGWIVRGLETEVAALAGSHVRMVGSVVWRSKGPPTIEALGMMPLFKPLATMVRGPLKHEGNNVYSVGDWALQFAYPRHLLTLAGQEVAVTGNAIAGTRRPTLNVTNLQCSLTGTVTAVTNLETPHYELNGFVLAGAAGDLQTQTNRPVTVEGSVSQEVSLYMKPVLNVTKVSAAALPKYVVARGQVPALPTAITLKDGYLMLPLRAVIEAAGGKVTWDPALWAVRVALGNRTTTVRIGSRAAGADLKLAVAPYLKDGHTMAPLELFESLGLRARWGGVALYLDQDS